MSDSIPLELLPGSSKIFQDFLIENTCDCSNVISKISERIYNRSLLTKLINFSIGEENLSDLQKNNLILLQESNTFAVVTGQQAGFLGGSLYTLFKAVDTIRISNELSNKYPDFKFVPIFWIEDNDDDLKESSVSCIYDSGNVPKYVNLNFDENLCVSGKKVVNEDLELIQSLKDDFKKYQFGQQISEIIDEVFEIGKSWSECFQNLYQKILGQYGLLFISASELMKSGIFQNLVLSELINTGYSQIAVDKRNKELEADGYHIQAQVSDINLFYHIGDKRFRIDIENENFRINNELIDKNSLIKIANENPENFCPKVLLRPIFQDAVLPTVVYVAGPGEIAYHKQTDYLYNLFNVIKPCLVMRTSATIIDKKAARYLSKIELKPSYFLKSFSIIEKELADNLLGAEHNEVFSEFQEKFLNLYSDLEKYLLSIDNQLDKTVNGALVRINEQINQLDKKAHSAAKRTNEELLQKYQYLSNLIFPAGKLQERTISPLVFLAQSDELITQLLNNKAENKHHIFIEI
ncbi:MAG: bacillithiol biosynthesis cysteine-adding enzyme BshC [Candidatus Kapabacteria bacterium]|nr:bacillithiol biosynthesis cysteine-adding enzyme BshC [Ignavibacteriota bacterium]MCW5885104.1 bacillithiol biosynthesis cysteine-adding enzyme BshC [Candidatus Kapabacteria bacterium]